MRPTCTLLIYSTLIALSNTATASALPADLPHTLNNALGQNNSWSGVGRLGIKARSRCVATLLDTRDTQAPAGGPAYVVTAGQCANLKSGEIRKDTKVVGYVSFNFFADTLEQIKSYPLKSLRWSSGYGSDLAIIELDASLAALIAEGIQPLKLASKDPQSGSSITVVGAPEWKSLQSANCTLQPGIAIVRYPDAWTNALVNRCEGIKQPGMAGAPWVDAESATVFGVSSPPKKSITFGTRCTAQTPCELNNSAIQYDAENNYASSSTFLTQCFKSGFLTSTPATCNLYPTTTSNFRNLKPIQQVISTASEAAPRWQVKLSISTPFYRYGAVRMPSQCQNTKNYKNLSSSTNALIDIPLDNTEGLHFLCVIGIQTAAQTANLEMMDYALKIPQEMVNAEMLQAPLMEITQDSGPFTTHRIRWRFRVPSHIQYRYKHGPLSTTDCKDQHNYKTENFLWLTPLNTTVRSFAQGGMDDVEFDDDPNYAEDYESDRYPEEKEAAHYVSEHIYARKVPHKICTYVVNQTGQISPLREDIIQPR